jgi:hypothetical protein
MIRVKLSFPYQHWPILRQTPNFSSQWGNYVFFLNDQSNQEFDFWVVFEDVPNDDETICNPNNTLLIIPEPPNIKLFSTEYINQFNTVISCIPSLKHPNNILFQQGQPWFVNKSIDELLKDNFIPKTKKISVISSNKKFTKGHQARYDFVKKIKKKFGNEIDIYGRGINEFEDKWDVLSPYQFSICLENSEHNDYFSEKLADCFLSHTFPIYWGCSNLDRYFEEKSFMKISIQNFQESINTINNILNDEHFYESRLPYIIKAKELYLKNYSFFALITNQLDKMNKNLNISNKKYIIKRNKPNIISKILFKVNK